MDPHTRLSKSEVLKLVTRLQEENERGDLSAGRRGILGLLLGAAASCVVALGKLPALLALRTLVVHGVMAATPVGWAGAAAASGVVAWGASRWCDPGSARGMARELVEARRRRAKPPASVFEGSAIRSDFFHCLRALLEADAIAPANAFGFVRAVESGLMPVDQAHGMVLSRLYAHEV